MATDDAFLKEISAFLELPATNETVEHPKQVERGRVGMYEATRVSPLSSPLRGFLSTGSDSLALGSIGHRTRSQTNDVKTMKRQLRQQKEAIRKQRYQRRLKQERETLRRLDGELSRQLVKLQQGAKNKKRGTVAKLVLTHSIWRDLAILQRGHRLQAENEQKKLVAAVSVQASYLALLRGMLPKDLDSFTAIKLETRATITSSLQVNKQANHVLYDEHLRQVVASYARFGEVFREYDLVFMPEGITASMHRHESTNAVEYFQHFNKFSQPFSFQQTQQTMWRLAKLHHRQQDREDYEGLANPEDTVILRFRLVRTLVTGATVSVMQRYISRRFVDDTRTIFTWKTFSEGEGIFAGMLLEETGWACLQPSDDGSTVVGVCVRQTPMRFGDSNPSKPGNPDFFQVMQNSVNEDAQAITSDLTKQLLEDTLAGIDM